jgi:hypothetical protein
MKRSQYMRMENPLHEQSEKTFMLFSKRAMLELATLRLSNSTNFIFP